MSEKLKRAQSNAYQNNWLDYMHNLCTYILENFFALLCVMIVTGVKKNVCGTIKKYAITRSSLQQNVKLYLFACYLLVERAVIFGEVLYCNH